MAPTGLDIFKLLPKTNCGDCGVPTCLAFAMKLAAGQAELSACPHVSSDASAQLSEASAPPIRVVEIGTGDAAFKVGGELVMYRHEKTFFNPTALAILINDTDDAATVDAKLAELAAARFERVGHPLEAKAACLWAKSGDAGKFKALVEKADATTSCALILISSDPAVLGAGLEPVAAKRPLVGPATDDNVDAMAALAKEMKVPLLVSSQKGLEGVADLTAKCAAAGVADLVIDPGPPGDTPLSAKDIYRDLIFTRRASLKQKNKDLGYPTAVAPAALTDDANLEMALAAAYIAKYAGIVVLSNLEPARAYPLLTLVQNIYTDPQQPMQVQQGIYPINNPTTESPVLITTNFSLTYFTVSSEIEASRVPTWLLVMDVEGLSVLTAWGAGKFVPDKIAKFVKGAGIKEKIGHNQLTIPGYVAQLSGEIEEELEHEWNVAVGVREAADIAAYLKSLS
jgi:acetyl-CoA decarbonylase/synthase, CODH/ACS complex subunit gamma